MGVKRTIRQAQSVMPFGVGAIYDIFGESFAACDTSLWGTRGSPVVSSALREQLGVEGLRSAPSVEAMYYGIPFVRFPSWLFCQRCRTLFRWSRQNEREDEPAICIACKGVRQLVPMRFVVACRNGHLGDVPWHLWAHSGSKTGIRCDHKVLEFSGRLAGGSGLSSLQVTCKKCRTGRSLAGLTTKDSLTRLKVRCFGTQPWQLSGSVEGCDADAEVVQRGASNVYFADVVSALDIPQADGLGEFDHVRTNIENHPMFPVLRKWYEEQGPQALDGAMALNLMETLTAEIGVDAELVRGILRADGAPASEVTDHSAREWTALITPQPKETDLRSPFLTRHTRLTEDDENPAIRPIAQAIDRVVLVTRLKEVRALRAFSRLDPGNPQLRPDLTSVDKKPRVRWAPAVEVFGEGVFVSFREAAIASWEVRPAVLARSRTMQGNLINSNLGRGIVKQRLGHDNVSARFVFLHTFAHLLIRELCFECGYSSASLRERIYSRSDAADSQAGILIFTAAGDVEGTLGGLVRQGENPRLLKAIAKALESADWCAADPICRESHGQGYDDTNLAACHACTLLPETSCVTGNMLLDRSLVMNSAGESTCFFQGSLLDSTVRA